MKECYIENFTYLSFPKNVGKILNIRAIIHIYNVRLYITNIENRDINTKFALFCASTVLFCYQ